MKKKTNVKCVYCNSKNTIKKGFRKSRHRLTQKYQCTNESCKKYFTIQPKLQKNKTYPLPIILQTITNINLGYSLKQTKNYFKKHKIKKSTLSYWYNQLKPNLPYHRIRNQIKKQYLPIEIIKTKKFTHHKQPFTYQYHKPKLDINLKSYPKLKHYLENIEKLLPKNFNNTIRISHIAKKKTTKIPLTTKQNYATALADIALQITKSNKQRHYIIENLMLKNDTTTIATEIPVYHKNLTGHIDILQIRYNKLHILDFKPEKIKQEQATSQLYLYAKALSNITKIPLNKFKCAFFNNKNYYEFSLL